MSRMDRYQDPELIERLAGEYVLGTLRGLARARFERLAEERPHVRHAVDDWVQRLAPLAQQIPEVAPPRRVWRVSKPSYESRAHCLSVSSGRVAASG